MSKKVLIIEDDELNMTLLCDLIGVLGHTTLQAKGGNEALALAREHIPDVILMDIRLHGASGIEVTKWIKEDDTLKSIPIIAVTAHAMVGDEELICSSGCDAYISKPFTNPDFFQTIKKVLG